MTDGQRITSNAQQHLFLNPERLNTAAPSGLWFCADVIDQSALEQETGNAVCLPTDGTFDDLNDCGDFFRLFPFVVVAHPDSKLRGQIIKELHERLLAVPLMEITDGYAGCPNMAGFVRKFGADRTLDLLRYGRSIQAAGLIDFADIPRGRKPCGVPSGIGCLDRTTGGFAPGELTVWTGRRGEGKSTLLGQILLTAVQNGQRVFAYSGELRAETFRRWTEIQAAGRNNVQIETDAQTGREYAVVPRSQGWYIGEWLRGRFFLFDNSARNSDTPDALLSMMEFAHRRYGCTVFALDNLMSMRLPDGKDFYRAQSEFVGRLVSFTKETKTHVHLVAHPRKTDSSREFTGDDVGGSGDILNRADNALLLERLPEDKAQAAEYSSLLTILKNRAYGARKKIALCFDPVGNRYYEPNTSPDWQYLWESDPHQFDAIGETG